MKRAQQIVAQLLEAESPAGALVFDEQRARWTLERAHEQLVRERGNSPETEQYWKEVLMPRWWKTLSTQTPHTEAAGFFVPPDQVTINYDRKNGSGYEG